MTTPNSIGALFQSPCDRSPRNTFVIAEAGVNHNGDIGLARRLVETAARSGADAVKFQTFKAEKLVTRTAPKAGYQEASTGTEETQFEMLRRLELSEDDHRELLTHCRELGIVFISTPFDEDSAEFLAELGVPLFKIPSGEVTNIPFLEHVAKFGRPILMSTGMSYLGEVELAIRAIREVGNRDIALLHCVSNYPADPADVNLRAMKTMQDAFRVPVGYSDHTLGIEVSLAAVAVGACAIEKHFTLDRNLPGPDHASSVEPGELAALVTGIRNVESALGNGVKAPAASEAGTAAVARRSLVAERDIQSGKALTLGMIAIKRPGTGLSPSMREALIERLAKTDIAAGDLLTFDNIG